VLSPFEPTISTTTFVARYLVDRKDLTVVTNALTVARELAVAHGVTVVVAVGTVRASELSLVGHITENALHQVRLNRVIMDMRTVVKGVKMKEAKEKCKNSTALT
jgi:DeoR/GlpR family transcriptional regulator of sugar metabolism